MNGLIPCIDRVVGINLTLLWTEAGLTTRDLDKSAINWDDPNQVLFINSAQHKNTGFANFALAVPYKMN